jgi:hypothetical protein
MLFSVWIHCAVPAGSTQSDVGKENCALIPRASAKMKRGLRYSMVREGGSDAKEGRL